MIWIASYCLLHEKNQVYGVQLLECVCICGCFAGKDGGKVTTVVATPGQGPDRPQEVSYTDTKVIGNGSFGVVYQAKLCDTGEMVAIKKVLQDKRFKVSGGEKLVKLKTNNENCFQNRELQIMRRLEHCNIVKLKYFFYSSGDKVRIFIYSITLLLNL